MKNSHSIFYTGLLALLAVQLGLSAAYSDTAAPTVPLEGKLPILPSPPP